jgi:serine/threonine protein kinase
MEFTGKALNGYQLLEYMGSDGISTLYKASASKGEKFVAIKVFPAELAQNRQILESMRASFQALSRMSHPGVVPVMNFSMSEGHPYVVLPFLAAGSLEDRIAFGALAAINTEVVIKEAASALEKAHSQGLVHGNLNPSQIYFDENGRVQIIGIGEGSFLRLFSQSMGLEAQGTFDYRAPEAKNGGKITPLSDQYSLALIALQLLARLPIEDALRGLVLHTENKRGARTRPNSQHIGLPSKVIEVLSRALSTNPSNRFPSIKAMFQALQTTVWKETPSPEARPIQKKAKIGKPGAEKSKRNRVLVFAVAIFIVLCLFAMEPVFSLKGDLKLASLFSNIGLKKSTETVDDPSVKMGMTEPVKVTTLVPGDGGIVIGGTEILPTSGSPTDESEEGENETPVHSPTPTLSGATSTPLPTQVSPNATSTPVPTKIASHTPSATSPPTSTVPPTNTSLPTIPPNQCSRYYRSDNYCTPVPGATINPDWCSEYSGSDYYCTPTPEPTIPPNQCSRYHRSDNYCTPVPGATINPDWCSEYSGSDYYCTPAPEPTIPPDQCSRDYHDDNFCTRTPEP